VAVAVVAAAAHLPWLQGALLVLVAVLLLLLLLLLLLVVVVAHLWPVGGSGPGRLSEQGSRVWD